MVRAMGLVITLLHVVEADESEFGTLSGAQAYLDGAATQFRGIDVRTDVRRGQPAREILNAMRDLNVDIIAMATHSRPGIERPLLGGVAEQVIRESGLPVLLVRSS
jgi:nucleotide-binding universal stress UspA family protein